MSITTKNISWESRPFKPGDIVFTTHGGSRQGIGRVTSVWGDHYPGRPGDSSSEPLSPPTFHATFSSAEDVGVPAAIQWIVPPIPDVTNFRQVRLATEPELVMLRLTGKI